MIGFPLAYYLARYASTRRLPLLVVVPFWTSILIRTYAWLIIFEPRLPAGGDLGWLYHDRGRIRGGGLQLPAADGAARVRGARAHGLVARGGGAGPRRQSRAARSGEHASLAAPGVVAGSLLVFIPMMGEYLNPVILGGDKTVYAGNLIGQQFLTSRDWPFGSAIAMVLILSMTVVVLVYAAREREEAVHG